MDVFAAVVVEPNGATHIVPVWSSDRIQAGELACEQVAQTTGRGVMGLGDCLVLVFEADEIQTIHECAVDMRRLLEPAPPPPPGSTAGPHDLSYPIGRVDWNEAVPPGRTDRMGIEGADAEDPFWAAADVPDDIRSDDDIIDGSSLDAWADGIRPGGRMSDDAPDDVLGAPVVEPQAMGADDGGAEVIGPLEDRFTSRATETPQRGAADAPEALPPPLVPPPDATDPKTVSPPSTEVTGSVGRPGVRPRRPDPVPPRAPLDPIDLMDLDLRSDTPDD